MKSQKQNSWKTHLDELITSETSREWIPFPKQYLNININKPIITRQISTKFPSVHVIAKITEDFAADVNTQDEESLPPRVFCWNDVSTLSTKMAFKTISSSLENEYRKIVKNATFDIKSFSSTSRAIFPDNQSDYLIYHIINPSFSESAVSTKSTKFKYSFSNNQLSNLGLKRSTIQTPKSFPDNIDANSLQQLGESLSGPSIFIFDCPKAVSLLENVINPNGQTIRPRVDIFAFGATNGILPCSSQLPYDLFTSCLLTPAKVALLMQTKTYEDFNSGILSPIDIQDLINEVNNSPISEQIIDSLEKALEQFADRIALESLEKNEIQLFEFIFRRDPLIANLFYHYLFACRIMKCVSTTPFCFPNLPDMTNHPLWDTFDLEVDRCLFSLKKNVGAFSIDILLEEQMRLLEDWIAYPIENREMPDELSYLAMLLDSEKYFERAIRFTAQFLSISAATTEKFLNTKAFPVLIHKIPHLYKYVLNLFEENSEILLSSDEKTMNENKYENENDNKNENGDKNENKNENENGKKNENENKNENDVNEFSSSVFLPTEKEDTFADFSFSIASSILLSPDLRPSFDKYVPFWEKLLLIGKSERLIISCLSCLIQFDIDGSDSNIKLIKVFTKHKSSKVRTLAHFLLKKLKVPLELPMCKISDEEDPFCRVALVSRISESITEDNKHDLIFDLILSLSDLFSFVREEAVVTLAQAIEFACKDSNYLKKINMNSEEILKSSASLNEAGKGETSSMDFFGSLKTFFTNYREDDIQNPIILSLAREISFLTYDPSNRVRKRFSELLFYIESILFPEPLNSKNSASPESTPNKKNLMQIRRKSKNSDNIDFAENIPIKADVALKKAEEIDSSVLEDDSTIFSKDNDTSAKESTSAKKLGTVQPRSNLFAHCLSAIVHYTPEASDDCYFVSHADLNGNLAGTPAVSPSGLVACATSDGGILCQSHNGGTVYYNFFNQSIIIPPRFRGLVSSPSESYIILQQSQPNLFKDTKVPQRRRKCAPSYIEFIDDEKLLAVSNSSQVIVIDIKNRQSVDSKTSSNEPNGKLGSIFNNYNKYKFCDSYSNDFLYSSDYTKSDPACSFWMEHPDNCYDIMADYNSQNFHLLEHQIKPESSKISIFDLSSQRRIEELLISKNPITLYSSETSLLSGDKILPNMTPQNKWCIGWLQSFSPLFYICTNNFYVYDERVGQAVQKTDLNLTDDFVVGCNSAIAMPLNVVLAKRFGSLAMIDFRTMNIVDNFTSEMFNHPGKKISSFKVHREIPFGFGTLLDNSAFSVAFNSGSLSVKFRETSSLIQNFSLHPTDAACVARSGTLVKFVEIRPE